MVFSTVTRSIIQVYNTFADPVAPCSMACVCGGSLAGNVGFEFRRVHGCPSLVSVVCCQVDVSAMG
jgi:hypothetical protein